MKRLKSRNENISVVLEEDTVGWYLTIFQRNNNRSSEDYLFDSLDDALEEAEERFGISRRNWHDVSRDDKDNPID